MQCTVVRATLPFQCHFNQYWTVVGGTGNIVILKLAYIAELATLTCFLLLTYKIYICRHMNERRFAPTENRTRLLKVKEPSISVNLC